MAFDDGQITPGGRGHARVASPAWSDPGAREALDVSAGVVMGNEPGGLTEHDPLERSNLTPPTELEEWQRAFREAIRSDPLSLAVTMAYDLRDAGESVETELPPLITRLLAARMLEDAHHLLLDLALCQRSIGASLWSQVIAAFLESGDDPDSQQIIRDALRYGTADRFGIAAELVMQVARQLRKLMGPDRYVASVITLVQVLKADPVHWRSLDDYSWSALLELVADTGAVDDAEHLMTLIPETGTTPNEYVWTALIKAYVRSSDIDGSLAVIDRMKLAGVEPNAWTWTVLVTGLVDLGNLAAAEDALELMQLGGEPPSLAAWTSILRLCARDGDSSRASLILQSVLDQGLDPDARFFTMLLRTYFLAADLPSVDRTLQLMGELGIEFDDYLLAVVIEGSFRNGRLEHGYQYVEGRLGSAAPASPRLIRAIVMGLVWVRDFNTASEILRRQPLDGPSLADLWLIIVREFDEADRSALKDLLDDLASTFGVVSVELWNVLLRRYAADGMLVECYWALSDMDRLGIPRNQDTWAYLVEAAGRTGDADTARQEFHKARQHVSTGAALLWEKLIEAELRCGARDRAMDALNEMRSEGTQVTAPIWKLLVHDRLAREGIASALAFIEELDRLGFPPDELCWTAMVGWAMESGDARLFATWLTSGAVAFDGLSVGAWEGIASIQGQLGRLGALRCLMDLMLQTGESPTASVWESFIRASAIRGGIEATRNATQEMMRSGFSPSVRTWAATLRSCGNDAVAFTETLDEMTASGVAPNATITAMVIRQRGRIDADTAEAVLDDPRFAPFAGDPAVVTALARVYALNYRYPRLLTYLLGRRFHRRMTQCVRWLSIALHRSGSSREALDLVNGLEAPDVLLLSTRCSIAAKVGRKEMDDAIALLFSTLQLSDAEIRDAFLRLVVVGATVPGPMSESDAVARADASFSTMLKARQRPQPILADHVRQHPRPWLAMLLAIAPRIAPADAEEMIELIDDGDERKQASEQLVVARRFTTVHA